MEKWQFVDFQIGNEHLCRHVAHFLFDNRSLVDFPIGNERKREFHPAEIRFYLHKEFRAAEIRFSLHKECRAAEIWFYLHKDFQRKIMKKQWSISKIFCAARANWLRIVKKKHLLWRKCNVYPFLKIHENYYFRSDRPPSFQRARNFIISCRYYPDLGRAEFFV